jgi:hypothetical protein
MDRATDQAIRQALGTLKIRPNDETFSSSELTARLKKDYNVDATVNDGILELKQGDQLMSTAAALRTFASKPENAVLFVSEGDNHKLWDVQKRSDWIKANGLPAWEAKIGKAPLKHDADIANADISRTDYFSMTNSERSRWIAVNGLEAQAAVLRKSK